MTYYTKHIRVTFRVYRLLLAHRSVYQRDYTSAGRLLHMLACSLPYPGARPLIRFCRRLSTCRAHMGSEQLSVHILHTQLLRSPPLQPWHARLLASTATNARWASKGLCGAHPGRVGIERRRHILIDGLLLEQRHLLALQLWVHLRRIAKRVAALCIPPLSIGSAPLSIMSSMHIKTSLPMLLSFARFWHCCKPPRTALSC